MATKRGVEKLLLYTNHDSSPTWRVRIALAYKRLKYERVYISFDKPVEEKYLKLNPLGQIPTLVADGEILTQSMAIIEYLDEKYPTPKLLPDDLIKKTRSRQIAEIINSLMQPMHNYFFTQHRDNEAEYFRLSKIYVEKGLRSIEGILKETSGKYCIGDEITIADVFIFPESYRAIEYGVELEQYPKVNMIWKSLQNVEAFMSGHPDNEPDCPKKLK